MIKNKNVIIYILGLSILSMNTTEAMTAGILHPIADFFNIPLVKAGRLITYYALSMAIGGPILVVTMRRLELRFSLISLMCFLFSGKHFAV